MAHVYAFTAGYFTGVIVLGGTIALLQCVRCRNTP